MEHMDADIEIEHNDTQIETEHMVDSGIHLERENKYVPIHTEVDNLGHVSSPVLSSATHDVPLPRQDVEVSLEEQVEPLPILHTYRRKSQDIAPSTQAQENEGKQKRLKKKTKCGTGSHFLV